MWLLALMILCICGSTSVYSMNTFMGIPQYKMVQHTIIKISIINQQTVKH